MSLSLAHSLFVAASASPYRLLDAQGQEVAWANAFLDAQRVRQLSPRSLRAYAYDLLHFARWLAQTPQLLSEITESTLLSYVRHQLDREPQPSPQTVWLEVMVRLGPGQWRPPHPLFQRAHFSSAGRRNRYTPPVVHHVGQHSGQSFHRHGFFPHRAAAALRASPDAALW